MARKFIGEEDVAKLGCRIAAHPSPEVGLEVVGYRVGILVDRGRHARPLLGIMGAAGDDSDASVLREILEQKADQQIMTEVIDGEGRLIALYGFLRRADVLHPGIADDPVERRQSSLTEEANKSADRGLVTEVEGKESGLPADCVELFHSLTAKVSVPACDNDEF